MGLIWGMRWSDSFHLLEKQSVRGPLNCCSSSGLGVFGEWMSPGVCWWWEMGGGGQRWVGPGWYVVVVELGEEPVQLTLEREAGSDRCRWLDPSYSSGSATPLLHLWMLFCSPPGSYSWSWPTWPSSCRNCFSSLILDLSTWKKPCKKQY